MRRLLAAAGLAVLMAVGLATYAAGGADREEPVRPGSAPSVEAVRDTKDICASSAVTVEAGLARFVTEMQQVTKRAEQGDLIAAEESVRGAGEVLVTLADEVRRVAGQAAAENLRNVLIALADELEQQGRSLTSLSALQTLDTKGLEGLARRMTDLCGGPWPSPSPSVSPSVTPSQTPSVTPSQAPSQAPSPSPR